MKWIIFVLLIHIHLSAVLQSKCNVMCSSWRHVLWRLGGTAEIMPVSCPCSAGECVLVAAVVFLPSPTDMYKRRRPSPRCCVVTLTHCELGISTTQLFFYTNYQHRHFPREEENNRVLVIKFYCVERIIFICVHSQTYFLINIVIWYIWRGEG